jgi:hypothetical protein
LLLFLAPTAAFAQRYTQRGFIEGRVTAYPQSTAVDKGLAVGELQLRYEGFYSPSSAFQIAGAVDVRTDTHHQTERKLNVSWFDRRKPRPLFAVRRLEASYRRGVASVAVGKQFIRWGKTDILNPTDHFAPRDFLTVVDNEFLGVTAVRVTVEKGSETFDAVWSPRLTPSRTPLPNQRWSPNATERPAIRVEETGVQAPKFSQEGFRWSHTGAVEWAVSYYQGYNHLASFQLTALEAPQAAAKVERFYPLLRSVGADTAAALPWFTVKAEAAYFASRDARANEHIQYVVQLERQSGEWSVAGGYAGDHTTRTGTQVASFGPDRGIANAFIAVARYQLDTNRDVALETSIRQNGKGAWARAEYSQAFGQHWRATVRASLIRGDALDFFGQYRRNSNVAVALRYSY